MAHSDYALSTASKAYCLMALLADPRDIGRRIRALACGVPILPNTSAGILAAHQHAKCLTLELHVRRCGFEGLFQPSALKWASHQRTQLKDIKEAIFTPHNCIARHSPAAQFV
jgi:hypothetical protein